MKGKMASAVNSCGHLGTEQLHLLLITAWSLIQLQVMAQGQLEPLQRVYYAAENDTIRIRCTQICHNGQPFQTLWNMQVPGYRNFIETDFANDQLVSSLEKKFGIQTQTDEDPNCSYEANKSIFSLEIAGVTASLNNSVVLCGVQNITEKMYIHYGMIIIVNRVKVAVTRTINYANESGVTIECTYTCSGVSNPQLLWAIEMSETEDRLELHDDDIRSQLENDLGITIRLVSEASSCDEQEGMASFYLVISGMNDTLQHSSVSCGVKTSQSSSETYSTCDSYIFIINQEDAKTEPLLATNQEDAKTEPLLATNQEDAKTEPLLATTLEKTATEPSVTEMSIDKNTSTTSAAVATIATPSVLGGFVIGILVGAIAVMLYFPVKKIIHNLRIDIKQNEDTDIDTKVIPNLSSGDNTLQKQS